MRNELTSEMTPVNTLQWLVEMWSRLLSILLIMLLAASCDSDLKQSLNLVGNNRGEMEMVLNHYKEAPDPLKYEAAKFLIENMPYHNSFVGEGELRYDSAYMAMAAELIQFRDSVFKSILKSFDLTRAKYLPDIGTRRMEG